ncbi:hypothetical protein NQ317_002520 [Molorchus minor]|uniref:Uncharacterized protein n=1 Tax=Molorchus minor TaxID=1323400 RepID=A0ABQ9IX89_9CUCU|nr:hypothetical protein NQ317_002520 [Molorchus minor]
MCVRYWFGNSSFPNTSREIPGVLPRPGAAHSRLPLLGRLRSIILGEDTLNILIVFTRYFGHRSHIGSAIYLPTRRGDVGKGKSYLAPQF